MALPLAVLGILAVFSAGIAWPGAPGSHWFENRVSDERLVKDLMTTTPVVAKETHEGLRKAGHPRRGGGAARGRTRDRARVPRGLAPRAHAGAADLAPRARRRRRRLMVRLPEESGKDYVTPVAPLRAIRTFLVNLWYVDAFFIRGVVPFVMKIVRAAFGFDKWVIDFLVNQLRG